MARNRKRPSRRVGSDSPPSKSAKEQSISGHEGGPRGDRPRGIGKQPPQMSGRRAKAHEPRRIVRGSYSPDEDPNLQGEPHSSPETLKQNPSLQGLAGRGQSSGTRSDDVEEEGARGSPRSKHTRHGRQKSPGDRSG